MAFHDFRAWLGCTGTDGLIERYRPDGVRVVVNR
jgi:hypothetical protein